MVRKNVTQFSILDKFLHLYKMIYLAMPVELALPTPNGGVFDKNLEL